MYNEMLLSTGSGFRFANRSGITSVKSVRVFVILCVLFVRVVTKTKE